MKRISKIILAGILAGEIKLSAVPGSTIGPFPSPPEIAGLYAGTTHFGFHNGEDWIAYLDNAGRLRCVAGNAHLYFDPAEGGTLDILSKNVDIEGTVKITAGEVGGFNVDPTEGLYIGTGATRVQMKPGVGIWCGATAFGSAPFRASPAGAVVCTNLTVEGGTWGGSVLAAAKIPSLDCDKITSGTFGTVRIPNLSCSKITSGTFDAVRIPNLDCDKITSGTFSTVRIPNLSCDKITSGTFDAVRIPNLSAAKITTGILSTITLDFATLTRQSLSVLNSELAGGITYNKISSVNADTVTTGILTGRTVRTAASGERVQMLPHKLQIIGATAPTLRLEMDVDGLFARYMGGWNASSMCALRYTTGRFTYSGATVYNANAPTAWTNLSLSSYVGSRRALVLLMIENNGGSATNYRFRMDGVGGEQRPETNNYPGVFSCKCDTIEEHNYVWCLTGTNGYIEWDADHNVNTVVTLLAYIS